MKRAEILAILVLAVGLMVWSAGVIEAAPMGTAFTYQGRLIDANGTTDGLYDFEFRLFDDPNVIDGNQVGSTIDVNDLDVIEGYFTLELDFGGAFVGDARWLQIAVRPGTSTGSFSTLSPRQEVLPTPYAIFAENAGPDNDWMLSGNYMYSIPSGNVGIGTTSPTEKLSLYHAYFTANNVEDMLEIQRATTGTVQSGIGAGIIFRNELDNGSMALSGRIASVMEDPTFAGGSTAGMFFETLASDGTMTNALYLDPDGKIGIGTTNPSSKLHVEGDTTNDVTATIHNLDNTGSESLYFGTNSASDAGISVYGSANAGKQSKWEFFNNKFSGHYDWITGGSVKMTLSNQGMLGIGYANPYAKLFVQESGLVDPFQVRVAGSTKLIVKNDGKVGIGTSIPQAGLHLNGTDYPSSFMFLESDTGEDAGIHFYEGSTVKWHIFNSSSDGGLRISNSADSTVLFAEQSTGKVAVRVLEITGGSDLSEQFDIRGAQDTVKPGMLVSIDPKRAGKLIISNASYDTKVAGIISGAGGVKPGMMMGQEGSKADGDYPVALTGRVYCWADASNGAIIPGDLLTTSSTLGHAMKVSNHNKALGAIIGKAMTSLEEDKGLVLVLVSLQ